VFTPGADCGQTLTRAHLPDSIDPMSSTPDHYRSGSRYWSYQAPIGIVGGQLNLWKFEPYIRVSDTVLDFGCGGGFLLERVTAAQKIGVEPAPDARAHAISLGLTVHASTTDVPAQSVDVVISNHALEHTERPLDELVDLRRILRAGGHLVCVVPIDDWRTERTPTIDDQNHHLYTWTPLLFANLLRDAGFDVVSCRVLTHGWRPSFLALQQHLPRHVYGFVGWLYAVLKRRRQIHAVAVKRIELRSGVDPAATAT
jgi:SAM-dependent methyltransferase